MVVRGRVREAVGFKRCMLDQQCTCDHKNTSQQQTCVYHMAPSAHPVARLRSSVGHTHTSETLHATGVPLVASRPGALSSTSSKSEMHIAHQEEQRIKTEKYSILEYVSLQRCFEHEDEDGKHCPEREEDTSQSRATQAEDMSTEQGSSMQHVACWPHAH
jgi:hypothetical protein